MTSDDVRKRRSDVTLISVMAVHRLRVTLGVLPLPPSQKVTPPPSKMVQILGITALTNESSHKAQDVNRN